MHHRSHDQGMDCLGGGGLPPGGGGGSGGGGAGWGAGDGLHPRGVCILLECILVLQMFKKQGFVK